jgi:hypothetical protein
MLAALLFALMGAAEAHAQTITFVGSATAVDLSFPGAPTISQPAATQVGDFVIVFLAHNNSVIDAGLEGWTVLRGGSTSDYLHVLYRFADQAGSQSYGWHFLHFGNTRIILHVYRNVSTSAPINAVDFDIATSGQFTRPFTRPTTTAANAAIIRISHAVNESATDASIGHSCVALIIGFITAGDRIASSRDEQASPGQIAVCNATATAQVRMEASTLALAPAAGGGGSPPAARKRFLIFQ